jgi:hypothetical protein
LAFGFLKELGLEKPSWLPDFGGKRKTSLQPKSLLLKLLQRKRPKPRLSRQNSLSLRKLGPIRAYRWKARKCK